MFPPFQLIVNAESRHMCEMVLNADFMLFIWCDSMMYCINESGWPRMCTYVEQPLFVFKNFFSQMSADGRTKKCECQ